MNAPMLTTFDNKWDPFTRFEEWHAEDIRLGHDCCEKLDRALFSSTNLGNLDYEEQIRVAINEIVALEPLVYKKVERKKNPMMPGPGQSSS